MGRKTRKRIIYESDDEPSEEEFDGKVKYVPWSLKVSDCFEDLLDLNEHYGEMDDRFKWLSVGDVSIAVEDMLWDRNLLYNLPRKVKVDELVLEFAEHIIDIMNLMENPYIDDPEDYLTEEQLKLLKNPNQSDSDEEEYEDDGTRYIVPPVHNRYLCVKFIVVEIYSILDKYYASDTRKWEETIEI